MKTPTVYTRRHFLKTSVLGSAMSWAIPVFLESTLNALAAQANSSVLGTTTGKDGTILVLLQLAGGNDGLNTIVPITNDLYYNARPTLGLRSNTTLKLNDDYGFNSNLANFKNIYDTGNLAIVQGVGYPNPNRSHFKSTDIWAEGGFENKGGWIGRYLDSTCSGSDPITTGGVATTAVTPKEFYSSKHHQILTFTDGSQLDYSPESTTMEESMEFFNALNKPTHSHDEPVAEFLEKTALDTVQCMNDFKKISNNSTAVNYPDSTLGNQLQYIAKMINGDFSTRVYYASQTGYDTHKAQLDRHNSTLKELDLALGAFVNDLKSSGKFNNVVIMTFSEFGRRVKQNGSEGTDHGAAAPLFVMGGSIKPGLFGKHPSLSDLDRGGDLKFTTDFRSVYTTILSKWLHTNPEEILHGKYDQLGFL
jgi:uncharacterized protein (DUF1501 family)